MQTYRHGVHTALSRLGLEKVANNPAFDPPPDGKFLGSAGQVIKQQLFGTDHRKAFDELSSGTWLKPGSSWRQSMWGTQPLPPDAGFFTKALTRVGPALNYIPAAMGIYGATKAAPDQKGEAYGSAIGNLAGTALGMRFGIVGSTAGSLALGHVGGMLGSRFNRKPKPAPYHPPQQAAEQSDNGQGQFSQQPVNYTQNNHYGAQRRGQ